MQFSVLIPMYNAEKYISECISSVLAQDFDDYEILIVDDGSTDNGPNIVDEYICNNPEKVRVIHKENSGVLMTRRKAIQEAHGEYIIWVDADDIIKPNLMRVMFKQIRDNHPDVVIFNYEILDSPEKVIYSLNYGCNQPDVDKHLIYTKLVLGRDMNELCTKCIRRKIIDADEDYSPFCHVKMGDDAFCLVPIIDAAKKIAYINEPFYCYRMVESSITHTTNYKSYYSYRTLCEREKEYIEKWNFSEQEKNEAEIRFSSHIVSFILQCIGSGANKEEYLSFVRRLSEDEKSNPICLKDKKCIRNSKVRFCYGLWQTEKYDSLFIVGKALIFFSNLKKSFLDRG